MPPSLRRVLYVDFLGALTTVVVMVCAAEPLAPHLGIAPRVLRVAGVILVPFVVFVLHTARSGIIRPARVYTIIAFNLLWLLASVLLLALGNLTAVGTWIIVIQALAVVPLIYLELQSLAAR